MWQTSLQNISSLHDTLILFRVVSCSLDDAPFNTEIILGCKRGIACKDACPAARVGGSTEVRHAAMGPWCWTALSRLKSLLWLKCEALGEQAAEGRGTSQGFLGFILAAGKLTGVGAYPLRSGQRQRGPQEAGWPGWAMDGETSTLPWGDQTLDRCFAWRRSNSVFGRSYPCELQILSVVQMPSPMKASSWRWGFGVRRGLLRTGVALSCHCSLIMRTDSPNTNYKFSPAKETWIDFWFFVLFTQW